MAVYIQSAAAISPQDTFRDKSSAGVDLSSIEFQALPQEGFFSCKHPDYKKYIDPRALRRMSALIRMGLATARVCLEEAGIDKPDAILVGSGLGCVQDTAKFLKQLIDNQEVLLNPTAFIQSTHNTVSGQIALMLACRAHNLTFSQNTLSFENALLEAMMLLEEGKQNILLGASDEIVEDSYQLMKKNNCVSGPMGEGSSFFVISSERSEKSMARVDGLEILNKNLKPEELVSLSTAFLASSGLKIDDLDFFISGRNGHGRFDNIYEHVEQLFHPHKLLGYKQLVGEYNTASAFGMWLGTQILEHNMVPDAARLRHEDRELIMKDSKQATAPIRRILLLNQCRGGDFSWILLSHPDT